MKNRRRRFRKLENQKQSKNRNSNTQTQLSRTVQKSRKKRERTPLSLSLSLPFSDPLLSASSLATSSLSDKRVPLPSHALIGLPPFLPSLVTAFLPNLSPISLKVLSNGFGSELQTQQQWGPDETKHQNRQTKLRRLRNSQGFGQVADPGEPSYWWRVQTEQLGPAKCSASCLC